VSAGPTFDELCELAPDLREVEAAARAVADDGGTLFCANNAWFSIKRALAGHVGVWRRPVPGESADDARVLGASASFETAFQALYPLLPPCRACGCELFEPHREHDLAEREARRGAAAGRPAS
jgi:hypothetical protein